MSRNLARHSCTKVFEVLTLTGEEVVIMAPYLLTVDKKFAALRLVDEGGLATILMMLYTAVAKAQASVSSLMSL